MTNDLTKTEADLSWQLLLEQLASRCHTLRGAALARDLAPLPNLDAARRRQGEIGEARSLQDRDESLSFGGVSDVRTPLARSA